MAYKWHAEVRLIDSEEYGVYKFNDLSDSELITIAELANRGHDKVEVKFHAERDCADDVAVISGTDGEVE